MRACGVGEIFVVSDPTMETFGKSLNIFLWNLHEIEFPVEQKN